MMMMTTMATMAMMTTTATMAELTLNSLCRIGAYEPVKRVYVDNSGQTSGLGLMGCRIAAGITTGMTFMRIIMMMVVMVVTKTSLLIMIVMTFKIMTILMLRHSGNPGGPTD